MLYAREGGLDFVVIQLVIGQFRKKCFLMRLVSLHHPCYTILGVFLDVVDYSINFQAANGGRNWKNI